MKKLIALLVLSSLLLAGCAAPPLPEYTPPGSSAPGSTESQPTDPTQESTVPAGPSPTESVPPQPSQPSQPTQPDVPVLPPEVTAADFKAVWLSQFDMEDIFTNGKHVQRDEQAFRTMVDTVMENVLSRGFNTVILQVRPYGDSMYPSAYYPMSKYTVGAYGLEAKYDPVAIVVSAAHAHNIQIHAWINPLRLMSTSEITAISKNYKLRQWYDDPETNGDYIVTYNNRCYLNPAYPEVRKLITDGAAEIFENYAFDGLHMDDYFYPTPDASFDARSYAEYQMNGGTLSLEEFRRDNLNKLVKALYTVAHNAQKEAVYGISPAGNIDTVYNQHYADIYTWCAEKGYIDYICPQVYFGLEHGTHDFKKVSKIWNDIIKIDSVSLIVGMTLGKTIDEYDQYAKTEEGIYEWRDHKDVIARCIPYTATLGKCKGISLFCYKYMFDPESGAPIPETAAEVANFLPVLKDITWNE